jgi:hypothetical protein
MARIGFLFVQSSIANTVWILAWHYENIAFSLVLKLVILVNPILIMQTIVKQKLEKDEKLFAGCPLAYTSVGSP